MAAFAQCLHQSIHCSPLLKLPNTPRPTMLPSPHSPGHLNPPCHSRTSHEAVPSDSHQYVQVSGCQDRIGAIADWYWQPDTCNLRKFDAEEFDHLLANKTLLVVGDSLGAQQYECVTKAFSLSLSPCISPPNPPFISLPTKS